MWSTHWHFHPWLTEQGYTTVETAADQDNQAMCRVNLSHGFSVAGMRVSPTRTQVLFSKQLR